MFCWVSFECHYCCTPFFVWIFCTGIMVLFLFVCRTNRLSSHWYLVNSYPRLICFSFQVCFDWQSGVQHFAWNNTKWLFIMIGGFSSTLFSVSLLTSVFELISSEPCQSIHHLSICLAGCMEFKRRVYQWAIFYCVFQAVSRLSV